MIARHSARLHQLVEDLLELSRIEAQRLKLQPETIELVPFFEHLASLYSMSASRRSLALRTSLASADLAVLADRRALEQILSNLIDNAIKYSTPGAIITVSAATSSDDGAPVAISVADTGPGILPHHLPRLFERFYRVDRGRSRDVGGTGLGLAIVKHLTEVQGGNVEVESTPGRGSIFTVRLPAARLLSPSIDEVEAAHPIAADSPAKTLTGTGS
jgi:two-component system phosphate regulon sensor histidine kinase PhoR